MGNDLSMAFPFVIFITLVCILCSLFIITSNDITLSDSFDNPDVPFTPQLHGDTYNKTSDEYEETEESTDWWGLIGGFAALLVGAAAFVFTGGTSTGLVIAGLSLVGGSLIFGNAVSGGAVGQWISGLPIIGNILAGLNYVATAISSFWNLMSFNVPYFGSVPLFGLILGVPVVFFFFVFIIRFIRGQ